MISRGGKNKRPMKVLVIEPDKGDQLRLLEVLNSRSYPREMSVMAASNYEQSFKALRREHPDLLLINAAVFEDYGCELVELVRSADRHRHTGIIFIADQNAEDHHLAVEVLERGADDFVKLGSAPEELIARVRAVLRLKAVTDQLRSANHKLRQLTLTDDLTGLHNMRSFNSRFADLVRRIRSGKAGAAVTMMDLDHFKSVNDSTSHLTGSYVIGATGKLLREGGWPQKKAWAARYGGDEFIMVSEASNLSIVMDQADHVRRTIAAYQYQHDNAKVSITASLGVAWVQPGFAGRAEDIIKAADLMLYRSKEQGRNRVSGMNLRYPVDLDHISRTHLVDGNTCGDDDQLSRVD